MGLGMSMGSYVVPSSTLTGKNRVPSSPLSAYGWYKCEYGKSSSTHDHTEV